MSNNRMSNRMSNKRMNQQFSNTTASLYKAIAIEYPLCNIHLTNLSFFSIFCPFSFVLFWRSDRTLGETKVTKPLAWRTIKEPFSPPLFPRGKYLLIPPFTNYAWLTTCLLMNAGTASSSSSIVGIPLHAGKIGKQGSGGLERDSC